MDFISECESMSFTKKPRGVWNVARYMLHTLALTLGTNAGKSGIILLKTTEREHVISALECISERAIYQDATRGL